MTRTSHRSLIALALLALLSAGCGAGLLPQIRSEGERLSVARRLHADGHYLPAAELLKVYVASSAGSAEVDEALFLLGDCYLQLKDWVGATTEFERLLRDYPESDSSASARFRLAEAEFRQARGPDFDQEFTLKAMANWQRYLREFPGHWLNAEARERVLVCRTRLADKLVRTGTLYLKLGLPEPARVYFSEVTAEYPDTAMACEAELGLALCDVQQGRDAEALTLLRGIEERCAGGPVGERAARERKRLEGRS